MADLASDIADGILPDAAPAHVSPLSEDFRPWHRIRKQFIRKKQWNELARRNVVDKWRADLQRRSKVGSASAMHIGRSLKCLVIPGDHLLDMRSLCADLSNQDCFVRYLGFNDAHGSSEIGAEVHVANNAVTSLSQVVPDSVVVRDRFESIANPESQAHKYLKEYGPYHIVNLDLCGSLLPNKGSDATPYYAAIRRLLEYQFANQKSSWLLFLTTMIEPSTVDEPGMVRLCGPTCENVHAHVDFAKEMGGLLPIDAFKSSSHVDITALTDEEKVRLFGVALGKWLLKLAQSPSPKWTVSMRRSYVYSMNEAKGAQMLSVAYELIPNFSAPVDATGMSGVPTLQKSFPTELECAIKIAKSVSHLADVEALLNEDQSLRDELLEEAVLLMESAGFNEQSFRDWVNSGEQGT